MTLAEIQQAGPGCEIQGELQLFVAAVKKIVNNQHCIIRVRDNSGAEMDAIVFGTTAVQVNSWYVARQRIEPGKGPAVRYQQRGNNPPGLAIDGSVFASMQGGGVAPAATMAPPPAQAAPPPAPAAQQPPPPPAHRLGALTDEQMLGALERWIVRLNTSAADMTTETFTAILQSMMVGVREGSIALAPAQAPPGSGQEGYWSAPPEDDSEVPF